MLLDGRADRPPKRQCRRDEKHEKRTTAVEDHAGNVVVRDLDCGSNPQPCLHYSSIIARNPGTNYAENICPYTRQAGGRGGDLQAKLDWEAEHPKNGWWDKIPRLAGLKGCEADEWPPYVLYYQVDGYNLHRDAPPRAPINKPQFIRLLDGTQNGRVGNKWSCRQIAERRDTSERKHDAIGADGTRTFYTDYACVYTRTTYRINPVIADPDGDAGLKDNSCYPRGNPNTDYRGFAVLNRDGWYARNAAAKALTAGYRNAPPFKMRRGGPGPDWLDPDQVVAVDGNSSRKATDEDLEESLGLVRCKSEGCQEELVEYADRGAAPYMPESLRPQAGAFAGPEVLDATAVSGVPEATVTLEHDYDVKPREVAGVAAEVARQTQSV